MSGVSVTMDLHGPSQTFPPLGRLRYRAARKVLHFRVRRSLMQICVALSFKLLQECLLGQVSDPVSRDAVILLWQLLCQVGVGRGATKSSRGP
jgi:hypothetical protein